MKIKALGAVLAKRFGVETAQDLVPWHPTLGDVDSAQALADYQAAKRVHKAEWSQGRRRPPADLRLPAQPPGTRRPGATCAPRRNTSSGSYARLTVRRRRRFGA